MAKATDSSSSVDLELDWDAESIELRAPSPSGSSSVIVLAEDYESVSLTVSSCKLISSMMRALSLWMLSLF